MGTIELRPHHENTQTHTTQHATHSTQAHILHTSTQHAAQDTLRTHTTHHTYTTHKLSKAMSLCPACAPPQLYQLVQCHGSASGGCLCSLQAGCKAQAVGIPFQAGFLRDDLAEKESVLAPGCEKQALPWPAHGGCVRHAGGCGVAETSGDF